MRTQSWAHVGQDQVEAAAGGGAVGNAGLWPMMKREHLLTGVRSWVVILEVSIKPGLLITLLPCGNLRPCLPLAGPNDPSTAGTLQFQEMISVVS